MRQTTQIIEKIGKLLTDRIDQANICCLRLADTLETVDLANIHENSRNTELKQLLNKLHDVFKRQRSADSGAKLARLIAETSLTIFRKMSPYFQVSDSIKPVGLSSLVDLYVCYWTYTRDMRSSMLLKSFYNANPSNLIFSLKFILKQLLDTTHTYFLQRINAASSSTNFKQVEEFRNRRAHTSSQKKRADIAEQRFIKNNNWRINGNQIITEQLKVLVYKKQSATKVCRLVKKLAISNNETVDQENNYDSFFISSLPPPSRVVSASKPQSRSTQHSLQKFKSEEVPKKQKSNVLLSITNNFKHCSETLQIVKEKACKSMVVKQLKRSISGRCAHENQKNMYKKENIKTQKDIERTREKKVIGREKFWSSEKTSKQKLQLMKNNYNVLNIDQVRLQQMTDERNLQKICQQVTNRNKKRVKLTLKMREAKKF